ncbi:MAG: HlyD family efflux transporter periplasmic adaptor subunit [Gemmatimonadota bacterium]|jgi:HlyD family secretion protein|nr:HlyD family efflux transporter periplasmic adaptor subunit [Gemmatimonadota bacterium]MDQ8152958.1 HlyD family efflux transporter periplasmic adaptor subunit [Gemmatimonadota bacterium]MDQ8178985.1 HlyD family efflux transporter periplasmic adaptor subunit [Gemmatimonadota bacterium]
MKHTTRWRLLAGVATLIVLIGVWQRRTGRLEVETAEVRRGAFEEILAEEGRTRVRWHLDLTAPVSGQWDPAALEVGDTVKAGAALGVITAPASDPATQSRLTAQLGAAEATLAAARATEGAARSAAIEAKRTADRAVRLGVAGGVAEADLERVQAEAEGRARELEAATAQATAAAYARDAVRALLPGGGAPITVRAPAGGVILRIDEAHGRVIPAGSPLLMLGAAGAPEVVVDILSRDAERVPRDAALRVISGSDTIAGRVRRVEPTARTVRSALGVEEQRVQVIGVVDTTRGARLGHDFAITARIVLSRRESATVVPTGALVRDGSAWSVFVVDAKGRARRTPVTLIARGTDESAVEGVSTGTTVVLYPPEALKDGSAVRR